VVIGFAVSRSFMNLNFTRLDYNILKILKKMSNKFHQIGELKTKKTFLFQVVKNILAKSGMKEAEINA